MEQRPVLYFARFVPDYSVPPLMLLNERLSGRLVVCSGKPPEGSSLALLGHSGVDDLPVIRLRNRWLLGDRIHFQHFGPAFREVPSPSVVLAEESPRSLSLPLLLRRARLAGSPTILWGHFSSNRRPAAGRHHIADRYRLRLAQSANACVCYTDEIAGRLASVLPRERVYVARNTLDTRELFRLDDRFQELGKAEVRATLDLPADQPVLLFIGRLAAGKGLELLLETFRLLRARGPFRLVIIGDGPERRNVEALIQDAPPGHVVLTGALNRLEESAPWLFAADVALLPGPLGLAVNQAFSLGLPVVSVQPPAEARFHGPEASYVRHGDNGMLAAPEPDALAQAVEHVLADHHRFAVSARSFARSELTIERMVDGLEAAIRAVEHRA